MLVCVGSCASARLCGLIYVFSRAFYSSASKTRSPVPCSPSRITAHILLLTSSIRAINKYIESTTLYHAAITFENRGVTQTKKKKEDDDENQQHSHRYYLLIRLLQRYQRKKHITFRALFKNNSHKGRVM